MFFAENFPRRVYFLTSPHKTGTRRFPHARLGGILDDFGGRDDTIELQNKAF
jgi:hypothetical protein